MKTPIIDRVRIALYSGAYLTQDVAAMRFGLSRLSDHIYLLRKSGMKIGSCMITKIRQNGTTGKVKAYYWKRGA